MTRRLLAAAVLVLAAGCGDDQPAPNPAGPAPEVAATTAPAAVEGPASEPHTWPDGLTVKLTKVEQVPRSWGVDVPADRTVIRLTLTVTNTGTAPAPVESATRYTTLLYGPNRMEADAEAGYSYDTGDPDARKELQADGPTRFAPGVPATLVESSTLPAAEMDELAVEVRMTGPDGFVVPWTFTGVEELITTVK